MLGNVIVFIFFILNLSEILICFVKAFFVNFLVFFILDFLDNKIYKDYN